MGGDAGKTSTWRFDHKLAEEYGLTRNTVRKYVGSTKPPKYQVGRAKPSLLDPFKPYIDAVLAEYNLSARRIFDDLQRKGFEGGYGIVKTYVRSIKQDHAVRAEIFSRPIQESKPRSTGSTWDGTRSVVRSSTSIASPWSLATPATPTPNSLTMFAPRLSSSAT